MTDRPWVCEIVRANQSMSLSFNHVGYLIVGARLFSLATEGALMATMYRNTWELENSLERTLQSHCKFLSRGGARAEPQPRQSGGASRRRGEEAGLQSPWRNAKGGWGDTQEPEHLPALCWLHV